jgi:hypothetical protein
MRNKLLFIAISSPVLLGCVATFQYAAGGLFAVNN